MSTEQRRGPDHRPGGWHNRDFHDEVPTGRRPLERGVVAGILVLVTFVVFMYAIAHESNDCGLACYDISERPYEAGHAWTAYQGSWQWQAQWVLGVGGFVLALAALASTGRYHWRHWTVRFGLAAVALSAGWVLWLALEPALPTI